MNEKLTNQKDNLARLMAGENLTVVHKRIPTAYFDVKNRVLACPIFKGDISPALYDLFMGHEVGHALNTPFEGLHSALEKNRTLKGYLNVIEDIRIEKAIKAKYPGLRTQFFKAYKELVATDFFGIDGKDVNKLSLIDRINLLTKVGSTAGCEFVGEEIKFVEMAEACVTWEDVVACATAIYEWSKENEVRTQEDQAVSTLPDDFDFGDEEEEGEEGEGSSSGQGDEEGDEEEGEESMGSSSEEGEDSLPEAPESESEEGEGEDGEEEGGQGDISAKKQGGTSANEPAGSFSDDEEGARESITEYNAHNNEGDFLEDAPIIRETHNLTGSPMFAKNGEADNIVVTMEKISERFEGWYAEEDNIANLHKLADYTAKKIIDKNKTLISHMAKEFEMKQNAQRSVKAFQGKTGKLDMNAVAKYQVMDDIFKKVTYLPDGKNHGVVVLLDWSGSIYSSVKNLLEQSLILAEFCKKVNIPYRIYAFSDQYKTGEVERQRGENVLLELFADGKSKKTNRDMMRAFGLIYNGYLTAETRSWDKSEKLIADWFGDKIFAETGFNKWDCINGLTTPYFIRLGGTPLDNSLLAMRKLLPEFRNSYQLEKVILTVITDGFSHGSDHLHRSYDSESFNEQMKNMPDDIASYNVTKHEYLIDPYSRKQYPFSTPNARNNYRSYDTNGWTKTANLLDWLQKETGVNVTGYFALDKKQDFYSLLNAVTGLREELEDKYGYDDNYRKTWGQIRKEGLVVSTHGYGKLFLCCSSNLKTVDDELSDDLIGAKKSTLLSNFKKNRSSKVGSRFLTNEFIKEIA